MVVTVFLVVGPLCSAILDLFFLEFCGVKQATVNTHRDAMLDHQRGASALIHHAVGGSQHISISGKVILAIYKVFLCRKST